MSEEKNVQNERSTREHEEEFLKRVEQAAARGAKKAENPARGFRFFRP